MFKLLKHGVLRLSLNLIVSLFLPVTLWGQTESLYSIVGQCFTRNTTPPGFPEPATWDWSYKADVTLEAGGEIIETKTDDRGRFAFPEINSRQVRVIIQQPSGQRPVVYAGTVELMPGENIVLFQLVGNMQYTQPAITVEGDKWIYRNLIMRRTKDNVKNLGQKVKELFPEYDVPEPYAMK